VIDALLQPLALLTVVGPLETPTPPPGTEDAVAEAISSLFTFDWWLEVALPRLIRVVVILVISMAVLTVLLRTVNRVAARAATHATKDTGDSQRSAILAARKAQRATTLGSLFRNVCKVLVYTFMLLLILAEFGFDLGPLLAGAGIAGVAIGFGAQSLVKDVISGVFILMEDQYGVGDVVDLGDAVGTVDEVQLRVTKLRSIDGTLWFVRNGEILRVGNMSQEYSKIVLDVAVAYGTDIGFAKEVLAEVAHEFATDPDTRDTVLEEPEVLGVQTLGPDSVQIRILIKTAPGEQWAASRELRERI
jgi:small conductance mechanosensitive channel